MKQLALNFYEALKWLIGYRPKAMSLTNKWIELDKQEQYRIAQAKMWDENHAKKVRPFWHSKLNTTEKNTLKLFPTPKFKTYNKSDADYVNCDGNKKRYLNCYINFYAPSDIHFSNEFILSATDADLDLFDIEGDQDFKNWFFETCYKLIKLL